MNDAMGQADHVVQVFETGRLSSWTEILGWVFIGSVLVGLLVFQQWLLAGILGLGLLLFPLLGRHEIYQRVAVEETGIRYRRALNRERRLYWSHVSGARLRGDWLELLGKPRPIRIWVGRPFVEKEVLLRLLAEYLPEFIHIAPPLTVQDLDPPEGLPLVSRLQVGYLAFVLLFGSPMGLLFLAGAGFGITAPWYVEEWWQVLFALLFAAFMGGMGLLLLAWVVHLATAKIYLDEDGVRVHSLWRGGYLAWSQVEEVMVSSQDGSLRLRGKGKGLNLALGYLPVEKRSAMRKAVQYYVVLHGIPVKQGRWLLP